MPKVEILVMMSNVFDFIHWTSEYNIINLQSEFKIKNAHYPNVEMVWILRQPLRGCNFQTDFIPQKRAIQQLYKKVFSSKRLGPCVQQVLQYSWTYINILKFKNLTSACLGAYMLFHKSVMSIDCCLEILPCIWCA
jgi:hypothetical protein